MALSACQAWLPKIAIAAALLTGLNAQALALSIELKDVAPDRIERQRKAAAGELPLPGTPDVDRLEERLAARGLEAGSEVFIRIFKAESELELWLRKGDRFALLDTYPICHWSGTLGPKLVEGDKQNPEGFYKIRRRQLHLTGRWPRSLDVGFPNPYDRSHGRTGSYILVHGGCSSIGCFAITNPVMQEIYGLTEKALRGGQEYVDVHVFPFRMSEDNMQRFSAPHLDDFWRNLKEGYDAFEATQVPPQVGVCGTRYGIRPIEPSAPVVVNFQQRSPRSNRFAGARDFACPIPADNGVEVADGASPHGLHARQMVRDPRKRLAAREAAKQRRRPPSSSDKDASNFPDEVFFRVR